MDVILQKSISRGTNHLLMPTTISNQNGWMVSQLTICKMIMYVVETSREYSLKYYQL